MQAKPRTKKPAKTSSLVPLLFTLGVIGWGFFAIDRLTSGGTPDYKYNSVEAHDYSATNEGNRKTWKMSIEDYIQKFSLSKSHGKGEATKKNEQDSDNEIWTVVDSDNKNQTRVVSDAESSRKKGEYILYYYEEKSGKLKLTGISKNNSGEIHLKEIFSQLISGPSKGHNKSFIDSFPVKPTVLGAFVDNQTMILDLDDNFGHGISFETAQLQIDQILKTALQFKVSSVQFLINGEKVDSIQADGLTIPSLIKVNSSLPKTEK